MKKRRSDASAILRDALLPWLFLLYLCALLVVEQRGYQSPGAVLPEDELIDEDRWNALRVTDVPREGPRALLVTTADEEAQLVCEQTLFVLDSMGWDVRVHPIQRLEDPADEEAAQENEAYASPDSASEPPEANVTPSPAPEPSPLPVPEPLPLEAEDIRLAVICDSDLLTLPIDAEALLRWVEAGGRLILAGGLDSAALTEPWEKLLGLVHQDAYPLLQVESMRLETALLAGGRGMEFSDDVIRCQMSQVRLRPDALVHIATADEAASPLLWEVACGGGLVLVSGADLMDSKANRGVICACVSRMSDVTVWPVINAAVYCIDDFPSAAPAGYDRNVRVQFGYTVADFYANVWWPAIREIGQKYDIPYSCFLIQCYDADTDGPFDNQNHLKTARYFAQQILEDGGEIGIHGYNHQPLVLGGYTLDEKNSGYVPWPSNSSMVASIHSLHEYAALLSPDISLQAYVPPSNVLDQNGLELLAEHFEDLRVFAGVYIGTFDQLVQEFSAQENGVVFVPRLTADMQMEDSEWWTQINALNFQFVESNYIHPDDILDEERNDGGDFTAMLAGYERMVEWNQAHHLRAATISQAAGAVQRYSNLSVRTEASDNGVTLTLGGRIDTACLLLRLRDAEREPVCAEGGRLTPIDEGLWLLEADEDLVRIEWRQAP